MHCDLETPFVAPQTFVNQGPSSFQSKENLSWFWLQPYYLNQGPYKSKGPAESPAQSTHAILTEMGEGASCMPKAQGSVPTTEKKKSRGKTTAGAGCPAAIGTTVIALPEGYKAAWFP